MREVVSIKPKRNLGHRGQHLHVQKKQSHKVKENRFLNEQSFY